MTTIEARVAGLERSARRWRAVSTALLAAVLASGACAAKAGVGDVRASRFQLVDSAGRVRGELGMSKDGPALTLVDENGKQRIVIVGGSVSAITAGDSTGMSRAAVVVVEDKPRIFVNDAAGKEQASIGPDGLLRAKRPGE